MAFKEAKPIVQYDKNGNSIQEFASIGKAAKELDYNYAKFAEAIRKSGEYGEFKWKYKTEGEVIVSGIKPPVEKTESPKPQISVEQQEKVLQVTESQLNDLIGKALAKHVGKDDTKQIVRDLATAINPDFASKQIYTEETVPIEDYMKEPVMFYTYSHKYAIHSERRYGQEVNTPYARPIKFHNLSVQILGAGKSGREKEVRQLAVASITSKKECEWLRKSPKFGVKFFENSSQAQKVDVFMAEKLVEALNEISHYDYHQVRTRCAPLGIPDTGDIENMRRQLAIAIAQKNSEAESRLRKRDVVPQDLDMNREEDRNIVRVAAMA